MGGPDCGLVCIGREAAQAKLLNLTAAAAELNAELAAEYALEREMAAFAGYAPHMHPSRFGPSGLAGGAATPYGIDAYAHQGFPHAGPGFVHPHPGFPHAGPGARFAYGGHPLS